MSSEVLCRLVWLARRAELAYARACIQWAYTTPVVCDG